MKILVDTIMEKHAFNIKNWWGGLGPVQKYRQVAASPSFKIKKKIGQTAMMAAPVAAAAHWLDKPETPMGQTQMSRM